MRKAFSPEERHERNCERLHALVECFQRIFTADRVTQQNNGKVIKARNAQTGAVRSAPALQWSQAHLRAEESAQSRRFLRTRVVGREQTRRRSGYSPKNRRYESWRSPP